MVIGYSEGINNIIIITTENKKLKRKLGIDGLNICGNNYTYYDTKMQLHILDTDYIKEIKLYKDKEHIASIVITNGESEVVVCKSN